MTDELCHCGKPLHYTHPDTAQLMRRIVAKHGPMVKVTVEGRSWMVQRHYIALHGIKADELPTLGFKEVVS